ncbi:ABC transporter permease [Paenibacillus oryzisoli]|uniref:ABC transporter permease n=1 Tax=Paenibacillus oryzisoli TaxID=1850517 RepID=UPI003D26906F
MLWMLIRLELLKTRWRGLLLSVVLANLLLALWVVGSDVPNNEVRSYDRAFNSIMNYVGITYIVFAAVVMARMVIDEYRNKTITLIFAYPVPRRMLFTAKLIIIWIWTFLTVVVGNVFVVLFLLAANTRYHYIEETLTTDRLLMEAVRIVIFAVASAGMALVPMYFGMLRKTMPALLVSSFVLSNGAMMIVNNEAIYQNIRMFSMLALCYVAIGVIFAYGGMRRHHL